MNWLTKKKIVLIRRFSSRLRLEEWRSSPELVGTAKRFLMDPEFTVMVDVLRNESPCNWVSLVPMGIEERAIEQAKIEGYQLCINNLEAMGAFKKTKVDPEATYEQPEDEMRQQRT